MSRLAERIVDIMIVETMRRKGFDQCWNGVDQEIRNEIRRDLIKAVEKELENGA